MPNFQQTSRGTMNQECIEQMQRPFFSAPEAGVRGTMNKECIAQMQHMVGSPAPSRLGGTMNKECIAQMQLTESGQNNSIQAAQ